MKINGTVFTIGQHAPVWAPEDEGAGGAADGGDASTGTSVDAGDTPTDEIALGDDNGDGKSTDDDAAADDAGADGGKPDDAGVGEEGEDDSAEGADEVPEDGVYEFELPEGVELSEDDTKMWSETFKELGLTRGQADKLVQMQSAQVVQDQKDFADFTAKQQKDHLEAAKADKDIGGDKWNESKRVANLGLRAFEGTAIKNLILTSGNGNNPEIIRELMRFGETVKDDRYEDGSAREEPTSTEQSWYGDTTPDTKKG